MSLNKNLRTLLLEGEALFQPSVSLDCVIFGFHDNEIKVLLLKSKSNDLWALPGGFVFKEEHIDDAAIRVLKERTGINNIFLQQFHVFGSPDRSDWNVHRLSFKKEGIEIGPDHWLSNSWLGQGGPQVAHAGCALTDAARPRSPPVSPSSSAVSSSSCRCASISSSGLAS